MSLVLNPAVVLLVSSPRPLLAPTPRSIDQPGAGGEVSRPERPRPALAADGGLRGSPTTTGSLASSG